MFLYPATNLKANKSMRFKNKKIKKGHETG